MARAYEAELALWEKVTGAKQPGPLEEYLRRYPSGNFAELVRRKAREPAIEGSDRGAGGAGDDDVGHSILRQG